MLFLSLTNLNSLVNASSFNFLKQINVKRKKKRSTLKLWEEAL
jgi:hypothetical protein